MRRARGFLLLGILALALVLVGCGLFTPHTVSTPDTPAGPVSGDAAEELTFTAEGAICSEGHPLEYRFDWGDGTYSAWSSSESASNSWDTEGTYAVRAQARCANDASVVSGWSAARSVTVSGVGLTRDNGRIAITLKGVRTASELGSTEVGKFEPEPGNVFIITDVRAEALQDGERVVVESFRLVQADGVAHMRSAAAMLALDAKRLTSRAGMYTGQSASGEIGFEASANQPYYTLEFKPKPEWGDPIRFTIFP